MNKPILIDTNILIIILVGLIDPKLVPKTKEINIFEEKNYYELMAFIENDLKNLLILPNIMTEVDNLLNKRFIGDYRWKYVIGFRKFLNETFEQYVNSITGAERYEFMKLGLTDSIILDVVLKNGGSLITGDSDLADEARAHSIKVLDFKGYRNEQIRKGS